MPKHRAEHQLTDQNWDAEEEPEEAGEFKQAAEDVLKKRKIIKAVRKGGASMESSGSGNAFSGFGGFGAFEGNAGSLFVKPSTNGSTVTTPGQVSATVKLFEVPKANTQPTQESMSGVNGVKKKGDNSGYLKQLKSLNEGVLSWIKQHVEKNPYCLLTPIFNDYEEHLKEIEKKYPKGSKSESDKNKSETDSVESFKPDVSNSPEKPAPSGFTFTNSAAPTLTSSTSPKKPSPAKPSPFSSFKFDLNTSGFKPSVSFGAPSSTTGNNQASEGEEEYVPPKSEVKIVEEEGAVYTKRCKLFYQKDGVWTEKGVGYLHLKEVEDKSQLVIRADTNLGNVLLNILLSSTLPVKRQGKNNVSLMCVPNPPLDPKKENDKTPVPMLIRVKTGTEADELLAKINELKK